MTVQPDDDQQNSGPDDTGDDTGPKPKWRRDLEQRARAGDEATRRLAEYERKDVARKAGLDPEKPLVAMFLKGYDGDLTEDAIKDAATEVGLLSSGDAGGQSTEGQQGSDDGQQGQHPAQAGLDAITAAGGSPATVTPQIADQLEKAYDSGGREGLLDQLEKIGVPVTTRQ